MAPKTFKPPRMANSSKAKSTGTSSARVAATDSESSPQPSGSESPEPGAIHSQGARRTSGTAGEQSTVGLDQAALLPAPLLTKLLDYHFQDSKTKISSEANLMVGKYLDTFVREALARAKHEMDQKKGNQKGDFLEVEDLERLAPQLCLDF